MLWSRAAGAPQNLDLSGFRARYKALFASGVEGLAKAAPALNFHGQRLANSHALSRTYGRFGGARRASLTKHENLQFCNHGSQGLA